MSESFLFPPQLAAYSGAALTQPAAYSGAACLPWPSGWQLSSPLDGFSPDWDASDVESDATELDQLDPLGLFSTTESEDPLGLWER